ncbi:MAG TPA: hypothetical protein VJN18_12255 [Polyangiaceae bacterium]|nr:hypothetical protein [Polyangiaceae bacterium]
MRPERAFDELAVDFSRSGEALRCSEHNDRPARPFADFADFTCVALDTTNALEAGVEHVLHLGMQLEGLITRHDM